MRRAATGEPRPVPPRPEAATPPVSPRRRWAATAGFLALTVFTAWAVWSAFTVDAYIAEVLRANPEEAPNAARFPPVTYAAAATSVLMWGVVVLHLCRVVRWPWGTVLACVATLHTIGATLAIVSVASLGT
jgi:hypothetical protein